MDIELVVWMVRDASQKTPGAAASPPAAAADASGKSADDDDAGQSTIYYHPQALYVLRPLVALPAVCGADCGSCGCRAKPTSVRRVVCATPEWLQVHADAKNGPTPARCT